MTSAPTPEQAEPSTVGPVLRDATVGRDNIQIGDARDVTIISSSSVPPSRDVRWPLVRLFAAAVLLVIGTVAAARWSVLVDTARDWFGKPVLTATVTSLINVGDSLAIRDQLRPADQSVLLRSPSPSELVDVLDRYQAARIGSMDVMVVLQGQRHESITILDVRPRIIRSGPKLDGTCVTIPAQGDNREYEIKADLDLQRPQGGTSRYLPKSIELGNGERATVVFTATAAQRWYEWEIEVVYAYKTDGRPASAFFRQPDEQPFRVTGQAKSYTTAWGDPSSINVGFRLTGRNTPCGGR